MHYCTLYSILVMEITDAMAFNIVLRQEDGGVTKIVVKDSTHEGRPAGEMKPAIDLKYYFLKNCINV